MNSLKIVMNTCFKIDERQSEVVISTSYLILGVDKMKEINFEIISNRNKEIYSIGYIEIPSNDEFQDEEVEWYFYNDTGVQSRWFTHHDGVGLSPTEEQNNEIDQFMSDYDEDSEWIDTVIIQSEEEENKTYVRENITLIINDGEEME